MCYINLWGLLKCSSALPQQSYKALELIQQELILYLNTLQNSAVFQVSAVNILRSPYSPKVRTDP